jgi:hypothetical protein
MPALKATTRCKWRQRSPITPYTAHNEVRYSDMTVYTASSGSTVVATGSMQWNWGLDDFGRGQTSLAVQQATRNILNKFVNGLPKH